MQGRAFFVKSPWFSKQTNKKRENIFFFNKHGGIFTTHAGKVRQLKINAQVRK